MNKIKKRLQKTASLINSIKLYPGLTIQVENAKNIVDEDMGTYTMVIKSIFFNLANEVSFNIETTCTEGKFAGTQTRSYTTEELIKTLQVLEEHNDNIQIN